jgi:dihydrofolate reductase
LTPTLTLASNGSEKLVFKQKADLKHFYELTKDHTVVVGKSTWMSMQPESNPQAQPLKNRNHILVVTHDADSIYYPDDSVSAVTLDQSISLAKKFSNDGEDVFIIGGASIYQAFYEHADRIYLTHLETKFEHDNLVKFPRMPLDVWGLGGLESFPSDEDNEYPYDFACYYRQSKA